MTGETPSGRDPSLSDGDEILLSMFSDALGYEVTTLTHLTAEEELVAGAIVQGRLDAVSQQMQRIREGRPANVDILMDTKAQAALLVIGMEQSD